MEAQLCTADHERIGHVEAAVAHEDELLALELTQVLTDGEHIGQDLGGMVFVGQAVPYGNTCVLCQLLDDGLTEATVLNAVVKSAQNAGGIGDGFLLADLRTGRI